MKLHVSIYPQLLSNEKRMYNELGACLNLRANSRHHTLVEVLTQRAESSYGGRRGRRLPYYGLIIWVRWRQISRQDTRPDKQLGADTFEMRIHTKNGVYNKCKKYVSRRTVSSGRTRSRSPHVHDHPRAQSLIIKVIESNLGK